LQGGSATYPPIAAQLVSWLAVGVDWGHGCLRWLAALVCAQLDARRLSSLAVVLREMVSLTRSPVAFLKGA
jgi:p-aminobenzoyl-glutamate transporter AbgT